MHRRLATLATILAAAAAGAAESGLSVVVILDDSGSMNQQMAGGDSRINAAKRSLLTVLEKTPDDASVGVVLLNGAAQTGGWLVPLGAVDRDAVGEAVRRVRAGGATPLGAAMKSAADALLEQRDARRYGDYKLLIVSDGEATDAMRVERNLPEIQARGLLVDVIGVDMAQQHSLATRANTYRNAADPATLEQAIAAVVLGESTAAAQDAGETDFELLEALPSEVAAAALTTLTTPVNTPIGDSPMAAQQTQRGAPAPRAPNGPAAPPEESGGLSFGVVVGVFVFIIFLVLPALSKKSR